MNSTLESRWSHTGATFWPQEIDEPLISAKFRDKTIASHQGREGGSGPGG
jgi:hypothetical protein